MNPTNSTMHGHSAEVTINLHINGAVLPVAHLGLDYLILRTPTNHPPCNAEIHLTIDGQHSRWPVHLANGIKAAQRRTIIAQAVNGSTVG